MSNAFTSRIGILFLSCLVLLQHPNTHAHTPSQIEKEVLLAFDALVDASTTLDTEAYFSLIDETKFVGLNSNGTNWNDISGLKRLIESGFAAIKKVKNLEFTNVRLSVIDDYTVVLVNEYNQTIELRDGSEHSVSGGGTQVWSKRSGSWLLVSISAANKAQ